MSKQFNIVSLFSGWGGGDLGFHRAFFQTLLAVDSDAHSRASFKLNFEDVDVQAWDLMTVKAAFILNHLGLTKLAIDVLLMSPPCTGISKAGKCDPFNKLNLLYLRSIRQFIPGLLPRIFLIENVPMEGDMVVLYNMVQDELEKLKGEYHIVETTLNAIDFGSPQSRKRFFIMGVHKSLDIMPSFPEPTTPGNLRLRIKDVLPDVDGIAYGYGWKKFKHKSEELNTMTKTLNLRPVRNGEVGDFIVREVLDMGGYPLTWKTTGSILQVWNRAGNSIMPDISFALATHIRDNILAKADTSILLLPDVKPAVVAPLITTDQGNAVNKSAEEIVIYPAIPIVQDDVSQADSVIHREQVPPAVNQQQPITCNYVPSENKPAHNIIKKPLGGILSKPSVINIDTIKPGQIITSEQLVQMQFDTLAFDGKWNNFIGNPSADFYLIIHGVAGEGKSTLAIQFANYLANKFGNVLYVSGEEGISKTLMDKFINTNSKSASLHVVELKSFQDILRVIQPGVYRFIFIDSLQHLNIGAGKMRELRAKYKNTAFISISQSTKAGQMRGSAEHAHDSDIVIEVAQGLATTTKNRFKPKGTTFNVFEVIPSLEAAEEGVEGNVVNKTIESTDDEEALKEEAERMKEIILNHPGGIELGVDESWSYLEGHFGWKPSGDTFFKILEILEMIFPELKDNTKYLLNKSETYSKIDETKEAIALLDRAILIDPNDFNLLWWRWMRKNEILDGTSEDDLNKCLELMKVQDPQLYEETIKEWNFLDLKEEDKELQLKEQLLKEALAQEDFEVAAKLRDEISKLKNK